MADFIGGFDNISYIVGDFVEFAVGRVDGVEAFLEF